MNLIFYFMSKVQKQIQDIYKDYANERRKIQGSSDNDIPLEEQGPFQATTSQLADYIGEEHNTEILSQQIISLIDKAAFYAMPKVKVLKVPKDTEETKLEALKMVGFTTAEQDLRNLQNTSRHSTYRTVHTSMSYEITMHNKMCRILQGLAEC